MTTPVIPEGFTPWNGGECPCLGQTVQCFYSDGEISPPFAPGSHHPNQWKHFNTPMDIIAYRVVGDTE